MVGLMQIMIYLLAIYLVYKGVEIFQIAFVSDPANRSRPVALAFGILAIIAAVAIGVGAVYMADTQAESINRNMNNLPTYGK